MRHSPALESNSRFNLSYLPLNDRIETSKYDRTFAKLVKKVLACSVAVCLQLTVKMLPTTSA